MFSFQCSPIIVFFYVFFIIVHLLLLLPLVLVHSLFILIVLSFILSLFLSSALRATNIIQSYFFFSSFWRWITGQGLMAVVPCWPYKENQSRNLIIWVIWSDLRSEIWELRTEIWDLICIKRIRAETSYSERSDEDELESTNSIFFFRLLEYNPIYILFKAIEFRIHS